MRPIARLFGALATIVISAAIVSAAPSVDRLLAQQVAASPLARTPVVVTYDHMPNASDFTRLRALGIVSGYTFQRLPMVLTSVTRAQLDALKARPEIKSLYANRLMRLFDVESRSITGVEAVQADGEVTNRVGGLPVSGDGIGVAYVDTGIDATHPDFQYGSNVVQNVFFPLAEVSGIEWPFAGFVPPIGIEDQMMTDVEGGHGTFGASCLAGTGQLSGGLYAGMAPGADLVGLVAGNDAGLTSFAILQAFDYALVNQYRYNIRVVNNSWGTTLADAPYDPNDPIQVATRNMHDRNMVVLFAAGNDGDGVDMINPYSISPWVISVGAAEKRGLGGPADFTSRGNNNGTGTDVAGMPADANAPPNVRPDLVGSGVDIKAVRSKGPGLTNFAGTIPVFVGANDLSTIPPGYLPFYTTSQGTSFACPQVSGIVALMLQANPQLTPDEVVTILRQTATPMPYEERVVGAGYVDAHNAVRAALSLAAVAHPANLFPPNVPNPIEIQDAPDDHLGTSAQDIRSVDLAYDGATQQIVYTVTLADASTLTPNMIWTVTSSFGATEIFVTAQVGETSELSYDYGKITVLATGTRNQEDIGPADSGEISGNSIVIRLGVAKVSEAVGYDVIGTVSTAVNAQAQILIGTTFTGGLLLSSDAGSGSDFRVNSDNSQSASAPAGAPAAFTERLSGALSAGQSTLDVPVSVRNGRLDARFTTAPLSSTATMKLLDASGHVLTTSTDRRLAVSGLAPGTYRFRITRAEADPADYTITSLQRR